jgi:hypothetical protein
MRISSVALPLFLAACGSVERTPDTTVLARAGAQQRDRAVEDGRIRCAHADRPLVRDCNVERTLSDRGLILTLRHPDGAFHRLLVTQDGRGVVAADGARYALVGIADKDGIEVAIDGDRYRLPAHIEGRTS